MGRESESSTISVQRKWDKGSVLRVYVSNASVIIPFEFIKSRVGYHYPSWDEAPCGRPN